MSRFQKMGRQGATLIEILIAILVIVLTVLGALGFFSYGIGGIKTQGNSRAALQQASARLDQLMSADSDGITPPDGNIRWLSCSGSPCTWTLSAAKTAETVPVNALGNLRMESTVQWKDDPAAAGIQNDMELDVKVWFTLVTTDDDIHRVELKTLRTP